MSGKKQKADVLDQPPREGRELTDRFRGRRNLLLGAAAAGVGAIALAATSAPSRADAFTVTEVFDVHIYGGAYGDGSHDDTTAIQNTINAAAAVAGGATVYFPSGEYKVTSTLTVSTSHITLRGEGPSSLIMSNQSTGNIIEVAYGGTQMIWGTTIQDIAIYSSSRMTSGEAISFTYVQDVRLTGVQCAARDVALAADNLYQSLIFHNFTGVTIDTCMLTSNFCGLQVYAESTSPGIGADIWVTGGTIISKATYGVWMGGGVGGLYLDEVDIFSNQIGVYVDNSKSGDGSINRELLFNNCVVDTSQYEGVNIQTNGVSVVSFNGTYISNAGTVQNTGHPYGSGIRVMPGGIQHPSNMLISGCKIFNCAGDGIYAQSGAWTITGCDISLNGQGTTNGGFGVALSGGSYTDTGGHAETSSTYETVIVGNSITQNGYGTSSPAVGYGVSVDGYTDYFLITNNLLTRNTTAAILNSGGTHNIVNNNLS